MFEEHGVVGEVLEADFFALPDQNLRYDVITHWGLLEHFSDQALIISLSSSLLKPGGYLVFTMPNLDVRELGFGNGSRHKIMPHIYSIPIRLYWRSAKEPAFN